MNLKPGVYEAGGLADFHELRHLPVGDLVAELDDLGTTGIHLPPFDSSWPMKGENGLDGVADAVLAVGRARPAELQPLHVIHEVYEPERLHHFPHLCP